LDRALDERRQLLCLQDHEGGRLSAIAHSARPISRVRRATRPLQIA
jgi:hypothetical protein